ncbi:hypothetical protein BGZ73_007912 [Actinomortierella ambigua]|nr:hypothetical protein BGZ73_007912 [Actinomortierella ambigua]
MSSNAPPQEGSSTANAVEDYFDLSHSSDTEEKRKINVAYFKAREDDQTLWSEIRNAKTHRRTDIRDPIVSGLQNRWFLASERQSSSAIHFAFDNLNPGGPYESPEGFLSKFPIHFPLTLRMRTPQNRPETPDQPHKSEFELVANFQPVTPDNNRNWQYLKAEDKFEVRSHTGKAQVHINIIHDNKFDKDQCGQLQIGSLRLVPAGGGHPHEELAISATGEHLAVYEAPSIGNWQPGVTVPTFEEPKVYLFRNSFCRRPKAARHGSNDVAVNINHPASSTAASPTAASSTVASSAVASSAATSSTATVSDDTILERITAIPRIVENAVGYATFVGAISSGKQRLPARFVFCNGLYLDVFELHDNQLKHSNSIPLANLSSILLRTEACELLVRSIVNNIFLWPEANGRYCSTWDLSNGSAIGRIEITRLPVVGLSGDTAICVACSQGIIAIVGYDNSITTVDAATGMPISRRLFSGRIIKNVIFPTPQSDVLFAILLSDDEFAQSVVVLDPLRLEVQGPQDQFQYMPPFSRLTVFANFGSEGWPDPDIVRRPDAAVSDNFGPKTWPDLGIVCRPDGEQVCFYRYTMLTPLDARRNGSRSISSTSERELRATDSPGRQVQDSWRTADTPSTCEYELRTTEPLMRQVQETCKRQVEIWRKVDPHNPSSSATCVFSFIPEPWELRKEAKGMILKTGDRFVVYAGWTLQLWSLPTPTEPQCKLLYYWSYADNSSCCSETAGASKTDVVLKSHSRFDAICPLQRGEDSQLRFGFNVVFPNNAAVKDQVGGKRKSNFQQVYIPSFPPTLADRLMVTRECVKSILLLALTHSIVSAGNEDILPVVEDDSYEIHASAIIDFVNTHINHSVMYDDSMRSGSVRSGSVRANLAKVGNFDHTTVLASLLDESPIPKLTARFIASLFENKNCSWVPRNERELALFTEAIQNRKSDVVRPLLAYCARKATTVHPAYIMPVERSLEELCKISPDLLVDFFRKVSYIPAKHTDLYKTNVKAATFEWAITRRRLLSLLFLDNPPELQDYQAPIITIRLQEKLQGFAENRIKKFPSEPPTDLIQLRYDWRLYTVPFSRLLTLSHDSQFQVLAGENYFDSPCQLAILSYKMRNSEIYELPEGRDNLFLSDVWLRLIIVDIVLGCVLMLFELIQYWQASPARYFTTPFNYIDLASILLTTACLSQTLRLQFVFDRSGEDPPQQISFTTYAIIAMYLHLIVELRVFKPVGVIVNIIIQIMKKIRAFFLVFTLMVVAFTHGMVYLLYVYQNRCKGDTCDGPEASDFPYETFPAFANTFFFLAGRYDAVGGDFDSKRFEFLLLMVLFYFLCSIVLLTILTGQVTDAITDATKDGEQAWQRQLSETLSEAEMVGKFLWLLGDKSLLQNRSAPKVIYFMASMHGAEENAENLRDDKQD